MNRGKADIEKIDWLGDGLIMLRAEDHDTGAVVEIELKAYQALALADQAIRVTKGYGG